MIGGNQISTNPGNITKRFQLRSPAYPGTSLRQAVERMSEFYRRDGDAGAPAREAALHVGFRTKHGQALSAVAALKKFGLVVVDEVKDLLLPTPLALQIINAKSGDPGRMLALREAALRPRIYRELAQRYAYQEFPSDDVLQCELITNRGFNPKAVRTFIRDFKDTLEFADLLTNGVINIENPIWLVHPQEAGMSTSSDVQTAVSLGADNARSNEGQVWIRRYSFDVNISRKLKAELAVFGRELRKEDLQRLKKQVERLIDNLTDAIGD
jgi:hypothetical protein